MTTHVDFKHVSVLPKECIDALNIKDGGIYVDGTMGGGGHTELILKSMEGCEGKVIGIDQDIDAITSTANRLSSYGEKLKVVQGNFSDIGEILKSCDVEGIDGILLDLGVSSHQLDTGERGFSYMKDGPLDMRMDKGGKLTAEIVVNEYSEGELLKILFNYGEEKYSKRIVKKILEYREKKRISSTAEFVDIIKSGFPAAGLKDGGHPAKRTFQAIRIEVNNELGIIEKAIEDGTQALNEGGRIAIITFHSLEDRIVKNTFKKLATGCICPDEFPVCTCNNKPKLRIITRKPILPGDEEMELNSRSRSAKLRVAEKLGFK